jgi:hypothetical protein
MDASAQSLQNCWSDKLNRSLIQPESLLRAFGKE